MIILPILQKGHLKGYRVSMEVGKGRSICEKGILRSKLLNVQKIRLLAVTVHNAIHINLPVWVNFKCSFGNIVTWFLLTVH